jgi:hypothetical protein
MYANHRKSHFGGIHYIATIIDSFGRAGGFEHIKAYFANIASGKVSSTIEHLGHIMVFLSRTMPFWHREFLCTQMDTFTEMFLGVLGTKQASNPLNQAHTRI